MDDALNLFEAHGIKAEIEDQRFTGDEIAVKFRGKLSRMPMNAGLALCAHDQGILCAPTAFGKTVVAAWLLSQRKTNTLILVHRRHLLDQWRERLESFLELSAGEIGQIGGGRKSRGGQIDIAVMQSLIRKGEVKSLVSEYGQIIVDECRHVSVIDESIGAPKRTSELAFAEIERAAIQAVTDYESSRGWEVQSVEDQTRGFDLISRKPLDKGANGKYRTTSNGDRRFIEVKGRAH